MVLMRLGVVAVIVGTLLILWRRGVSSITPRVVQLPFTPIISDGRGWAGLLATSRSRPSTPLSASNKRSRSPGLYYFLPLWYFSSPASTPSGVSAPGSPGSWIQTPPTPSNKTRKFASYISNMTSSRGYPVLPTEEATALRPLKINVDLHSDVPYSENSESPTSPGTASKPFAFGNSRHNWFRRRRSSSVTIPTSCTPPESTMSARSSPPAYTREEESEARCCRRQQSKESYKKDDEKH